MTSIPRDPASGSGPDRPDRGWRARADHVDPADPDLLARLGIVIPDDASGLDSHRGALLDDPPPGRARRFGAHLTPPYSHPTRAAMTMLAVLLLASVALAGSLAAMLTSGRDTIRPGYIALASGPVATPGAIGGLLPTTGVRVDGIGGSSSDIRPALLLLPPDGPCPTCEAVLEALWRQANGFGVDTHLVVAADRASAAAKLVTNTTQGHGHVLTDPAGALRASFGAPVLRAVFVHADGVVGAVVNDPSPTGRYEQVLSPLRSAGAPPDLRPATLAP